MSFVPYPDINDPDFHDKLFWKKEFLKTMYNTDFQYSKTEQLCRRGEFKMQNHQEFIRNFISPETPYNGALLFHGTGVGKTCAAIGTTEGLRDYVHKSGKKIYVLSSENIRPNFYKELYDTDRQKIEENIHAIPGSYQCAGDRYYVDGYYKPETKARAIKDMIKEYYVFKGFGQFANFVDVELGAELPEHMDKPKMTMEDDTPIDIGDYFSNSVIVIDEAHGIAGEDKGSKKSDDDDNTDDEDEDSESNSKSKSKSKSKAKKGSKDKKPRNITKRSLFQVLVDSIIPACRAKGSNLKILLLTATPMKDDVRELGNLLQLLNENDGRQMESGWKDRIFPRGMMKYDSLEQAFNDDQEAELIKYARGYVSYVKGNNPVTFPKSLLPPANQLYEPGKRLDPQGLKINPIFSYRDDEGNIMDKYDIKSPPNFRFNLVKCEMDWYQYICYRALINGDIPNATLASDTYPRMISNMAFPVVSDTETPYTIIDNPDALSGILGTKDPGDRIVRAVHGNKGFEYAFRSKQKVVPGTETHVSPKKFISYDIYEPLWKRCGFFMMIDGNSKDYNLGLFSRKLELFVKNVNASPGIAYAYSEFVQAGAVLAALALESNGYVRYHPSLKQYINKDTGLPKPSLRRELPECYLFDLTDEQLQTLPENYYRCSVCGELYDNCKPGHKFNLATYVVVTGSQGGVKEIAEVVSDNMRGQKIKAVIGTKVTGTGVDFKWIRQIHILDPWHNNTRIFQAIGRGLRHCSHADLPDGERDVVIFKYASTCNVQPIIDNEIDIEDDEQLDSLVSLYNEELDDPVVTFNFTYRDLLTETVDEHMYRRVVRKDLIIKVIERVLKRVAIDCEFNKARNMFPGDQDYSRECDYMKCEYTCEGFQSPIRYVRRVRLYNNGRFTYINGDSMEVELGMGGDKILSELISDGDQTNEEFWDQFEKSSMKLQGPDQEYEELLVDIPIPGPEGGMDSSTYNLHFSAPQVDKAVKLISRLFQKTQALNLEKIVHLVRKLNPQLEDKFVYSALDKIVGNPPFIRPRSIIDKYGRKGKIIMHNNIYIYHPLELEDTRIPMSYRTRPLTIKSRYYNMDKLTAKKAKKASQKVSNVDPVEVQKVVEYVKNMDIESVSDIVTLHTKLYTVIIGELAEVLQQMVLEKAKNVQYLVEYCLLSGMAFFLPYNPEDDLEWTINDLLQQCESGKRYLIHIMNSIEDAAVNVMLYTRGKWEKHSFDNLPKGLTFMSYTDDDESDLPEIWIPHSDMTIGMEQPRQLLSKLNDSSELYVGKQGVYGMMSKPVYRTSQPIFQRKTIRSILLNSVKGYMSEYPNYTMLQKIKFKIFDQNRRQQTITKAQQISKRGEIKGKVCTTENENHVYDLVQYMSDVLQQPDNFSIISQNNPDMDIETFMKDLSIIGKLQEDGTFIPSKSNKGPSCNYLRKMLIVANYFNLNNVKWFLNPIDTAIYRPIPSSS